MGLLQEFKRLESDDKTGIIALESPLDTAICVLDYRLSLTADNITCTIYTYQISLLKEKIAGWIAARTTALCLQFDSPTLGPCFPIPRPIVLLSGRVASHWVTSQHIGSCHSASGRVTARWVVSHCIGLCHIALGCVTLHHVTSGQVSHAIIGSCHTIINPIWCAIPPCCYSAPLHALPHCSLRRFNLYLHVSLFSSCHCSPGRSSLA